MNQRGSIGDWYNRGDAHPRVTGCPAKHKAFVNIRKAREYMKENGVAEPKEVIKDGAGDTTPVSGSAAYHAISYGKRPRIYSYWQYEIPYSTKPPLTS